MSLLWATQHTLGKICVINDIVKGISIKQSRAIITGGILFELECPVVTRVWQWNTMYFFFCKPRGIYYYRITINNSLLCMYSCSTVLMVKRIIAGWHGSAIWGIKVDGGAVQEAQGFFSLLSSLFVVTGPPGREPALEHLVDYCSQRTG